ncbi:MAG: transglycosylase SLT domain-containing protein [Nitrospirota bacterium]|nr:transglycosylase SLT domain-containing protein [Nitrospirota bacterium]
MKHHLHDMQCRSRAKMIIPALCSMVLLSVLFSVSAGDFGGKEAFEKGKKDLDAGRYSDAVSHLLLAQREFPLLEDYAMKYLADAYHNLGEHVKSRETLRALIDKYPASPVRKKARMAEIREATDISNEGQLPLYEAYVRDFPEDNEAYYMYGQLLKKNNQKDKASAVFRKLYIRAGYLSAAARSELGADEITIADITERASNLIKQYDFEDAERDLKQALALSPGNNRPEILKNLAYALFKQKKYREAAELYGELNDLFYKARSQYRAGDKKGFETTLTTLIKRNDKKAGFLLITVAADKRREKDFDRAIQIYQDVLKGYPDEAEDALWGIGWTHYLSGNYQKSEEVFSQLHAQYDDAKYLYWQARSMEAQNKDASPLYNRLTSAGNNTFYAVLSYARTGRMIPRPASQNLSDGVPGKTISNERVEALISLDMREEAVAELAVSSRNTSSLPELIFNAAKFQELGEFKRSISLTAKLPYSEKLHRFWYPLAFWDMVEQASKRYTIDPMIILSVMREESRFEQAVKSPAGAYGLMQLMPQTAYRLDRSLNLGIRRPSQLTDPKNNIQLGSFYLKSLLNEFHSLAHMLAAYNAGELAVRSWQQRFDYRSIDEFIEDIPYSETRNYVKKVLTSYFQYKRAELPEQGQDRGIEIILGKTS